MLSSIPSNQTISVMLVDDHPVVLDGYRRLLQTTPDIRVTAEAGSGETARVLYEQCRPDVVVLDLSMPGIGGLETIRRLKALDANAHILVFTMHDSETLIARSLEAGATGYLTKQSGIGQMVEAVRQVAQGKTCISAEHTSKMIHQHIFGSVEDPMQALSRREFQIFQLLAEGNSVNAIADLLSISHKTVGVHHANIMRKLQLDTPTQLVRLALRCNVIQP